MWETLKEWDRASFIFLNKLGSESFDAFWVVVTQIESWIFLFFLMGFLIFKYYQKKQAFAVAGFLLLAVSLTYTLKFFTKLWVERLRPNNLPDLVDSIRILQFPGDFSFFSGHASVSFAAVSFLVLSLRQYTKWVYLFFIWCTLFSLSRIYVGVHYPSDILVGAAIGIGIAHLCYRLQLYYFKRKELKYPTDR